MTRRIVSYLRLVTLHGKRIADPPQGRTVPRKHGPMTSADRQELRDRLREKKDR